jgi:hypothetical protein
MDNLVAATCGQLAQLVKLGLNVLVGGADPCVNRSLLHQNASFRLKVGFRSIERSYPISGRFGHIMGGLVGKDIPHS